MDNNKGPLMVSVRCATYNHANYIRQCLDGFIMQKTSFRFEVIVHDDASTDGTTNIVREYAEKYPEIIKPMYETENQYSRNLAAMNDAINAKLVGKYIAICEGDDYWTDDSKLQRQVDALENHPDCLIAYCRIQRIRKDGSVIQNKTIPRKNKIKEGIVTLEDFCKEEFYNGCWCFHTSSFLARKEYVLKTVERNNFCNKFPYGDLPFHLWCLLHGNGYFINDICGCYRMDSGGYNSTVSNNKEFAISQQLRLIESLHYLDDFSSGNYTKYIKMRILRAELRIDQYKGNAWALYRLKYLPISIKHSIIYHLKYIIKNLL